MSWGRTASGRGPGARLCAYLILLLFAIRATIPAGFMPDLRALENGVVEIVICTPSGIETIRLDAKGTPIAPAEKDGSSSSGTQECAFGTSFAKPFTVPDLPELERAVLPASDLPPPALQFAVLPPAVGPPLGSRAPPSNLA